MKYLFYIVTLALPVVFMTAAVGTGGNPTPQTSVTSSSTQETRAYGVGGTGLTSTAPCLESTSVLFGLVATTHTSKSCILRTYAAQCKTEACKHRLRCLDPDLIDEAKEAFGCKTEK